MRYLDIFVFISLAMSLPNLIRSTAGAIAVRNEKGEASCVCKFVCMFWCVCLRACAVCLS